MQAASVKVDITPPKGVPMGGYLARTQPADGIHDPLFLLFGVMTEANLAGIDLGFAGQQA